MKVVRITMCYTFSSARLFLVSYSYNSRSRNQQATIQVRCTSFARSVDYISYLPFLCVFVFQWLYSQESKLARNFSRSTYLVPFSLVQPYRLKFPFPSLLLRQCSGPVDPWKLVTDCRATQPSARIFSRSD